MSRPKSHIVFTDREHGSPEKKRHSNANLHGKSKRSRAFRKKLQPDTRKALPYQSSSGSGQPDDVIVLSSGEDDSPVNKNQAKKSHPIKSGSLDHIGDLQSHGTTSFKYASYQGKKKDGDEDELRSDASLSDGEIRDTPKLKKSVSRVRKSEKKNGKHPVQDKAKRPREPSRTEAEKWSPFVRSGSRGRESSPKNTRTSNKPIVRISPIEETAASVPSASSSHGSDNDNGMLSPDSVDGSRENSSDHGSAAPTPLVQVTFLNSYIAERYDATFRKMIEGIRVRERGNLDKIRNAKVQESVTVVYHDCFQIDATAAVQTKSNNQALFGLEDDDIPDLTKPPSPESQENGIATPVTTSRRGCFNCGGVHSLNDCTEPKDWNKINERRQEFFNNNPSTGPQVRYHEVAASDDDRIKPNEFPDCVPGKVSNDLMLALGIGSKDLPPWIIPMRRCGFPPGYIRNCIVETSGLDFITGDESGSLKEEEEQVRYDLSKLPVYPGFSAPHTTEVSRSAFVKMHKDQPHAHQSNDMIAQFLRPIEKSVEARSPSPDVQNMEISSDDEPEQVADKDSEETNNSSFFYESTIPASPDSDDVVETEEKRKESTAPVSSPSAAISSSEKTAVFSQETVEIEEFSSTSGSGFIAMKSATLLKTSSVPELGSFSGVNILPSHDKFAEGVAPWPFEEPTQSTGRYNMIRNVLEESRKQKHNS